ncbi:CGNR zinc finger domain-containing protein [Rhizobium sp. G21]|uniref:CGNR zinc finger domain-containing protein n=1 Tax=Rhizobium sp. G21 TaxID=2758439 RepID=UPI001600AE27|nr:CGNR zinc finger domain-containing protein [Rhizobium sp. G21]MBB1248110.1 CGNR zinc finger domain-containing protein [Rhizobium sp. G21]
MSFEWTPHRFSGGALALDVANSVILRADPEKRVDRFAKADHLAAFPAAAEIMCAERDDFSQLAAVRPENESLFLELREKADAFYRVKARDGGDDPSLLADLLDAIARILRAHPHATTPEPVDLATARSALRLIALPEPERLKICPNCGWLFLDRSKNKSRAWCDMAVCGNRAKARLHYRRKKGKDG